MTTFDENGRVRSQFVPPCDNTGRPLTYQQYYRRKMFTQLEEGRPLIAVVEDIQKEAHWHQCEAERILGSMAANERMYLALLDDVRNWTAPEPCADSGNASKDTT